MITTIRTRPRSGRRLGLALALAVSALALPAVAQEVYDCSFPNKADNLGYVSATLALAREPGADTVTVVDEVIQNETGGPIEVAIVEESDSKFSMVWTVTIRSPGNDFMRVKYRLSIQKKSLAATLSGKPLGYTNNFSSRGRCALRRA